MLDRIERAGAIVVEYGYVATALKRMGCGPDFECDDNDVTWMHRRIGDDDLYFVAVPNEIAKKVRCSFRVYGKIPELWDPVSGSVRVVDAADFRSTADGYTELTLDCPPVHSVFVVFRPPSKGSVSKAQGAVSKAQGSVPVAIPVVGTWDVAFREPMATSDVATARFADLESWTRSDNPDIRYFSGTASYCMKFSLAANGAGPQKKRVCLDLGTVKNIAEVTINGRKYPALWKPPFTVDITDALPAGWERLPDVPMEIEVKVTNYWPNRLIGDARLPDDCEWDNGKKSRGYPLVKRWPGWLKEGKPSPTGRHAFSTCRLWAADEQPLESGLLGPVSVSVTE